MKLHEYSAKDLFEARGILVPRRQLVSTPEEAKAAAESIGFPIMLKAQVLVAGRGKAGGIQVAGTADEAFAKARQMFASPVKGINVTRLLVEERVPIAKELYVGLTIDRAARRPVLIASAEGGVDLEELAKEKPSAIVKRHLDPHLGLRPFEARQAAKAIGLSGVVVDNFTTVGTKMYELFAHLDCDLIESNPLALTPEGQLVAADTRITVDDSSLFRHPDLEVPVEEQSPFEAEAAKAGFSYVELDGDIGVIGNGAGLVMATLDMVAHYGGKPANFLDIGGGARAESVQAAATLVLAHPRVRVLLLNILGGITRCDEVAKGLVNALRETSARVPLVVRLVGTNEQAGQEILARVGISFLNSMEEAAQTAVNLLKGGG